MSTPPHSFRFLDNAKLPRLSIVIKTYVAIRWQPSVGPATWKFILITINIIKFHTLPHHRLIFHRELLTQTRTIPLSYVCTACNASFFCNIRIKFNKRERGIYSIYFSKYALRMRMEFDGSFLHTCGYDCMSTWALSRRLNISWICISVNKYYFTVPLDDDKYIYCECLNAIFSSLIIPLLIDSISCRCESGLVDVDFWGVCAWEI